MTLFWDRMGVVACPQHAPPPGTPVWRAQGWREISPGTIRSGKLRCLTCDRPTRAELRMAAANALYARVNKDIARGRGWSRRDPIEAPLFTEEQKQ